MKTRILAANALITLAVAAFGEADDRAKSTGEYLRRLQNPDGGFRADAAKNEASLRATLAAVRALKYLGGEAPDRAAAGRFVAACYDQDCGGFADTPGGKPDVPTTAVGAMAVVELGQSTPTYEAGVLRYLGVNVKSFDDVRIAAAAVEALRRGPPEAKAWLRLLEEMRRPDGTFGDARATGGATLALLRLGWPLTEPEARKIVTALAAGQNADGGFGKAGSDQSDLESTYRVARCYRRLNVVLQNGPRLRLSNFIAACRNEDGGYGVAAGQPSNASGTYYAAFCRDWLSGRKP
jgi:prenyltransferase beta subunit